MLQCLQCIFLTIKVKRFLAKSLERMEHCLFEIFTKMSSIDDHMPGIKIHMLYPDTTRETEIDRISGHVFHLTLDSHSIKNTLSLIFRFLVDRWQIDMDKYIQRPPDTLRKSTGNTTLDMINEALDSLPPEDKK
jgi:hypothetical protein